MERRILTFAGNDGHHGARRRERGFGTGTTLALSLSLSLCQGDDILASWCEGRRMLVVDVAMRVGRDRQVVHESDRQSDFALVQSSWNECRYSASKNRPKNC
jgi:hypothetical protein